MEIKTKAGSADLQESVSISYACFERKFEPQIDADERRSKNQRLSASICGSAFTVELRIGEKSQSITTSHGPQVFVEPARGAAVVQNGVVGGRYLFDRALLPAAARASDRSR